MTCAKRRVLCILADNYGNVTIGENYCDEPQEVCPRGPGEDYTKCKTICRQDSHAEIIALTKWFLKHPESIPTHALILGHDRVCEDCSRALYECGVKHVTLGEPWI